MRVALAVTSKLLGAAGTRDLVDSCTCVGGRDVEPPTSSQLEAPEQKATALIGRYLNAARVGFDEDPPAASSDDIRSGIENVCTSC